jgi:uncharacterized protein YkwD
MQVPRHRATGLDATRRRALLALAACLVVAAGLALGVRALGRAPSPPATPTAAKVSGPAATCLAGLGGHCLTASSAPSARARSSPPRRHRVAARRSAAGRSTRPTPSPQASATASPPPGSAAANVLALINQARGRAGLPPYTILSGLQTSSGRHTRLMADGCGLSHQCPGERDLGSRETAVGVRWTAAGENIGEGGPVADTTAGITQMAVALTQDMLDEQPPADGHRLNLLSHAFTHIGIAIYRAADGTVWMTQDFSN